MNIERISNILPELYKPIATPDYSDALTASAVLLIIHKLEQQWHLLLTTRAEHLSSHAGQISFPGGRFEDLDQNLVATAIRETEEEIGLASKYLDVISQLDAQTTLTGYRIFPYIAVIDELPLLTIDPGEVVDVFSVPLNYLIDSNNHQLESAFYQGEKRSYYKITWQDKIIWGATAEMIVKLSNHFD